MRLFVFSVFILLLLSCSGGSGQFDRKVKALGSPNQVTVISDEELWSTPVGDSLSYYLESVYPVLPRPEPLFDIKTFTPYDLRVESLRKELRTYLICASSENPESESYQLVKKHLGERADFSKVGLRQKRDQWAAGQLILYYTGPTDSSLAQSMSQYLPAIVEQVKKQDFKPLRSKAFLKGKSNKMARVLDSVFQVKMDVPSDYALASKQDSFVWLRRDWEDITANIMFREVPYFSKEQLTKEAIIALRNKLGAKHVETSTAGSVMRVNDTNMPLYLSNRNISEHYTLQAKGIWEMSEDFMGGPFVSYLIVREDRKTLLFIDAFVLAPGRSKRDLMQEMEVVIEGIKLN